MLYSLGGDAVALLHNPKPEPPHPDGALGQLRRLKTWPYRRILQADGATARKAT